MHDHEQCSDSGRKPSRSTPGTTPSNPSGTAPDVAGDGALAAAPVVDVCFFRHASLVHIPQHWRGALRELGKTLHDVTLEIFGVAPEAPDSLTTTVKRLQSLALDLRTTGQQLEELAAEPEGAHLVEAEVGLCRLAGRLAAKVKELARRLAAVG